MKLIKKHYVPSVLGLLVLMAGLFLSTTSFTVPAPTEDNAAIISAIALPAGCTRAGAIWAARQHPKVQDCLSNAPGAPYQLRANVNPFGPCPQGQGSSWEILVYAEIPCVNPPFCPLAPTILVARIIVGCDCEVRDIECYV